MPLIVELAHCFTSALRVFLKERERKGFSAVMIFFGCLVRQGLERKGFSAVMRFFGCLVRREVLSVLLRCDPISMNACSLGKR